MTASNENTSTSVSDDKAENKKSRMKTWWMASGKKLNSLRSFSSIRTPETEEEEYHVVSPKSGLLDKNHRHEYMEDYGDEKKCEGFDDGVVLDIMNRPYNKEPDCYDMAFETCGCNDVAKTSRYMFEKKNLKSAQQANSGIAVTVQGRLHDQYKGALRGCEEMNIHFDHVGNKRPEVYSENLKSLAAAFVKGKEAKMILGDESAVCPEENIECVPHEVWADNGEDEKYDEYSRVTTISVGDFLRLLEV